MGNQKRTRSHPTKPSLSPPPSPSEGMPCSSGVDLVPKEKSLQSVDISERKPRLPVMDIMDSSTKPPYSHPSLQHQRFNLSRSIFLKRSRHYYGNQYFRRKAVNHACASTSHGKVTPLYDEKYSFKLAHKCNADTGGNSDDRTQAFSRPERIRSSSLVMDAVSPDMVKMVCGICQKLLRRRPYILASTLSSSELSVVAVLVCGHVYHAECLEQQTCREHIVDPPCPLCIGLHPEVDASRIQD